jgi:hypothetical protein
MASAFEYAFSTLFLFLFLLNIHFRFPLLSVHTARRPHEMIRRERISRKS